MMSTRQWFVLLSFYVFYLLVGAFVFQSLEKEHERRNLNRLITLQGTLSYVIQNIEEQETKYNVIEAIQDLESHFGKEMFLPKSYKHVLQSHINQLEIEEQIILTNKTTPFFSIDEKLQTNFDGIIGNNITANDSRLSDKATNIISNVLDHDQLQDQLFIENTMWTLWNSFYFSFTAITTIGFGHMYPSTSNGQFFCIIYSIIGVPLNGILFGGLEGIYSSLLMIKLDSGKLNSKRMILVYATLYLIPGLVVFMVLPAAVFVFMEGWNFLESFYFAFITITTIGFGEYVAGYSTYNGRFTFIYRIGIYIWIVFGLGYFLMMANFVQKLLRSNEVRKIDRTVKKIIEEKSPFSCGKMSKTFKVPRSVVPIMDKTLLQNNEISNISSDSSKPEDIQKNGINHQKATVNGNVNNGFENNEVICAEIQPSENCYNENMNNILNCEISKKETLATSSSSGITNEDDSLHERRIRRRSSSLSKIDDTQNSADEFDKRCSFKVSSSMQKNSCKS